MAATLGIQTTLVDWLYRWHVAQAQLKEAEGDLETALALLDEAKQVYIQSLLPDLRPIAALKARIYLKQGRPDKARAWTAERGLSLADEVSDLHEFEHLTLARLEIANPLVNALLARLLQAAEAQKRRSSALDILLVQALAHEAQGNRPQALAALDRALTLAEPEGYVRVFVDEGEMMRLLIADFGVLIEKQAHGQDHKLLGYVDKLLTAFPQSATVPQSEIRNLKSKMVEPLSPRELEVLRLIEQGFSNQEIADRLFLAVSTVKGYTRTLFDKLQVQRRTEAVVRARELRLVVVSLLPRKQYLRQYFSSYPAILAFRYITCALSKRHTVMSNTPDSTTHLNQAMIYQIRIEGQLGPQWTDWFEGLTITLEDDGDTLLTGPVVDQAALYGLLKKVRDLGLPLVAVNQVAIHSQKEQTP